MTQHYTKNTVSAEARCNKCGKQTQHLVQYGRLGPCCICVEKLNAAAAKPKHEPLKGEQLEMFTETRK